jgi:hypothetical protein
MIRRKLSCASAPRLLSTADGYRCNIYHMRGYIALRRRSRRISIGSSINGAANSLLGSSLNLASAQNQRIRTVNYIHIYIERATETDRESEGWYGPVEKSMHGSLNHHGSLGNSNTNNKWIHIDMRNELAALFMNHVLRDTWSDVFRRSASISEVQHGILNRDYTHDDVTKLFRNLSRQTSISSSMASKQNI